MIFYLIASDLYTQQVSQNKSIYNWHDSAINKRNSGIFNGLLYVEEHRSINDKHKFFDDINFIKGSVTYDNSWYGKVFLKYNIFEDQLLAKYSFDPNEPIVVLNKKLIEKFELNDHVFQNLVLEIDSKTTLDGFFEVLYDSNGVILYKKHEKRLKSRTNERMKYHEFEDDPIYIVSIKNENVLIKNPKKVGKDLSKYKTIISKLEIEDFENTDTYLVAICTTIANNFNASYN